MRLVYHPLAAQEVVEAARFYESRTNGLGERFLKQVDEVMRRLQEHPYQWPVVDADIRRVMLKRFPFGVYYRIANDTLRVLTIKHHRRHPGYGTDRH